MIYKVGTYSSKLKCFVNHKNFGKIADPGITKNEKYGKTRYAKSAEVQVDGKNITIDNVTMEIYKSSEIYDESGALYGYKLECNSEKGRSIWIVASSVCTNSPIAELTAKLNATKPAGKKVVDSSVAMIDNFVEELNQATTTLQQEQIDYADVPW